MNNATTPRPWRRDELTYCCNVHPADSAEDIQGVIATFLHGVRESRQLHAMGAGLWFGSRVAAEFMAGQHQAGLLDLLERHRIRLFTLNGFPFGDFHAASVKEQVYTPDWSQPQRYAYTIDLAEILAACLPDDCEEGTISTLPLGFRHAWTAQKHQAALEMLCRIAADLADLRRRCGRSIRVCLEMEPDCVLESTSEMIDFFRQELPAKAQELGIDPSALKNHLGICFDVCHQAVMFEDIGKVMAQFLNAGIVIGKIQLSSALEIKRPDQENARAVLQQYAEPKYLHQVRTIVGDRLIGTLDLPIALATENFPRTEPWRVHFHVPIQTSDLAHPELGTTQAAILKVLDFLKAHPHCRPHLEVETYTWHVLPPALRPDNDHALIEGITEELNWLEKQMSLRGILQ